MRMSFELHASISPEALFQIIRLSHEALSSGDIITKRYLLPDSFDGQGLNR